MYIVESLPFRLTCRSSGSAAHHSSRKSAEGDRSRRSWSSCCRRRWMEQSKQYLMHYCASPVELAAFVFALGLVHDATARKCKRYYPRCIASTLGCHLCISSAYPQVVRITVVYGDQRVEPLSALIACSPGVCIHRHIFAAVLVRAADSQEVVRR